MFWRKVLDIYATDYDPSVDASKRFFQTVQNKMHWAIVRQTAAEIVHDRASAAKPQIGLTSWSGDQPRKGDVRVAKNYLNALVDRTRRFGTLIQRLPEVQFPMENLP